MMICETLPAAVRNLRMAAGYFLLCALAAIALVLTGCAAPPNSASVTPEPDLPATISAMAATIEAPNATPLPDCYPATDRYACARSASHNQRDGSNDRRSHRYARARLAGHNRRYGGDAGRPYAAAYRNIPADSHAPTHGHAAADSNPVPYRYPDTLPYIDSAAYSYSDSNARANRYTIGS